MGTDEKDVDLEGNNGEEERELSVNGLTMKTAIVEAKLDEGNIQEAESSVREGLSLNYEEARALLMRLEYQRGNVESALRVLDGIDLQSALQKLQPSSPDKAAAKRGPSQSPNSNSQNAASLVLEALYLKSKSLQKLRKFTEAAHECKTIIDSVEKLFQTGISEMMSDTKLQEAVNNTVELLPELYKQAGNCQEALSSYRRALLSQWNLDEECGARIQKRFAVFLMHSGIETNPPTLRSPVEGCFVPKNNLEEAILLLSIILRKCGNGKVKWDPSVMEHFTFALSMCNQTSHLAKHFEELMPGLYCRCDRWYSMALCYCGARENQNALNLLRKILIRHEKPNDIAALLLAAKLCSEDRLLASEGVAYARRAVEATETVDVYLKSVSLRLLGICLGKQAKTASSDYERSKLHNEALKSLDGAMAFDCNNAEIIYDLGLEYAEQRNANAALRCAKKYIDVTGGSMGKGWRLLALILSAQQRYSEAEVVTAAALDETAKLEQGPLLRLKAKLKVARSLPMDAIEAYRFLLALVQAQKKSLATQKSSTQTEDDKCAEFEVWQGLANLYSSLSHWRDAETCLEKARELRSFSSSTIHTEGLMHEARGKYPEALASYCNALCMDLFHIPCTVSLGALLSKMGSKALPVARSFLSDALRFEPTNRLAWYHLGMVHRDDGRMVEAADCFQAATMLEESDPLESFSSIS